MQHAVVCCLHHLHWHYLCINSMCTCKCARSHINKSRSNHLLKCTRAIKCLLRWSFQAVKSHKHTVTNFNLCGTNWTILIQFVSHFSVVKRFCLPGSCKDAECYASANNCLAWCIAVLKSNFIMPKKGMLLPVSLGRWLSHVINTHCNTVLVQGVTPLAMAVCRSHNPVIELLLVKGANPSLVVRMVGQCLNLHITSMNAWGNHETTLQLGVHTYMLCTPMLILFIGVSGICSYCNDILDWVRSLPAAWLQACTT